MNKLTFSALAFSVGLAFSAGAMAENLSKEEYKAQKDGIAADFKAGKAACGSYAANAKDICMAEANGKQKVAKAELEARNQPTSKTRYEARTARAEAGYAVAMEKCDDLAGNGKDVCVKEAKAAQTAAKADAKAQMKTSDANAAAGEKSADARKDAAADKREADYAVAKAKCDAFASDAKDRCMANAKTRFGKS